MEYLFISCVPITALNFYPSLEHSQAGNIHSYHDPECIPAHASKNDALEYSTNVAVENKATTVTSRLTCNPAH